MSVWYQCNVTAIAADKTAVAKFFNLQDSWEEVRTDMFDFSFGGKNAPGLTFWKIAKQNPDLIFLVEQQIECDTVQWFLMRFDASSDTQQSVFIQDSGSYNNEINKKIWEDFTKEHANLPADHWYFKKGNDKHRWRGFFNDFKKSALILNQADQYQEMSPTCFEADLDFDNSPLVEE
jgi:hypothetical protein